MNIVHKNSLLLKKFTLSLNRSLQYPEHLQPLLEPVSCQELEIYQVGLAVKNPRNDSEAELPTL